MTNYQEELVSAIWTELAPLLERHWLEIAHYPDIPLAPDRAAYEKFERAEALRCYTARKEMVLIGYAVFFVHTNLHYSSSLQAQQDVLFVAPEHRGSSIGVRLIRYAERELGALGVQVIYHHAKRATNVGRLLEHLGYELIDGLYGKRLDRDTTEGA